MEHFKIEHFEKEYPGKQFPLFHSLDGPEVHVLRERLAKRLGCSSADPLVLFKEFERRLGLVEGADADQDTFSLSSTVSDLNITPEKHVYLHWYRYDKVDQMAFADVSTYFSDIWYPGPDDLALFDASFEWILTITHDGAVTVRK